MLTRRTLTIRPPPLRVGIWTSGKKCKKKLLTMRLKQLQYMLDVYTAAHFHRISLGINLVMVHKLLIFYRVEKNFCNDVKIWFRLLLLICIFNSVRCRFDQIFHVEGWQRRTFAKSEIELELTGRAYPPVDQLIAFWLCRCNCWQLWTFQQNFIALSLSLLTILHSPELFKISFRGAL